MGEGRREAGAGGTAGGPIPPFFLSLELQLLQLLLENGLMRLGWAHAPRMGSLAAEISH